ncbi:MAG: DUF4129 domain-containing protein [Flavobacteriales bacterium]|jgi:hypothetical protein|nr:DUF4129 domain-containing protein [Flavobacteriales bacterium]
MGRLLLLFALLLAAAPAFTSAPSDSLAPDERPSVRAFNSDRIDQLRADLDYDRDLRRAPSLWDRFKQWLFYWLQRILGSRAGGFVVDNLIYLISFLAILLAIVVLSRNGLRNIFHGAPRSVGQVITAEEDIRAMDIPSLIAQAEAAGDWRGAIRLHYLLVLRKLVDQGLLSWSPERTDRDYMRQLKDPAMRARFTNAALIFQWVWYGHAEVDRARYSSFQRPFLEFEQAPAR